MQIPFFFAFPCLGSVPYEHSSNLAKEMNSPGKKSAKAYSVIRAALHTSVFSILLNLTGCLTAPPASMPRQSATCQKAYDYSLQRYEDLSNQYQSTNIVLSSTGILLYFVFPEALAIPVIGLPVSYIQHESLAKTNVETMIKDCSAE